MCVQQRCEMELCVHPEGTRWNYLELDDIEGSGRDLTVKRFEGTSTRYCPSSLALRYTSSGKTRRCPKLGLFWRHTTKSVEPRLPCTQYGARNTGQVSQPIVLMTSLSTGKCISRSDAGVRSRALQGNWGESTSDSAELPFSDQRCQSML